MILRFPPYRGGSSAPNSSRRQAKPARIPAGKSSDASHRAWAGPSERAVSGNGYNITTYAQTCQSQTQDIVAFPLWHFFGSLSAQAFKAQKCPLWPVRPAGARLYSALKAEDPQHQRPQQHAAASAMHNIRFPHFIRNPLLSPACPVYTIFRPLVNAPPRSLHAISRKSSAFCRAVFPLCPLY